ncbi:MAG: hypothetical protein HYT22_01935 [Candidatus Niyogibacteria bacterium]|nr:hypothetical protein [Candidatus Niyogibacteria bacterium]
MNNTMINKTSLKFIAGFVAIIGVSLISLYVLQTYFSPERQAERRLAELERLYAEDTYGGQTPEETLQLFIDALKAGDIELASRYFIVDKQEEWNKNFKKIMENGFFDEMITDLEKAKIGKEDNESVLFTVANKDNEVTLQISLAVNPYNKLWKIYDM